MQEEFKTKMDQLKDKKSDLEYKLIQLKSNELTEIVTEENVRNLLKDFRGCNKQKYSRM